MITHAFQQSAELQAEMKVYAERGFKQAADQLAMYEAPHSLAIGRESWPFYMLDFLDCTRDIIGERVLDLGCGVGRTSLSLAVQGNHVAAVEPSRELCEAIEWNAKRLGLAKVDVHQTTAEQISQISGEFDVAIFHSSLHHCDDPQQALKEAYAKLKPGGRIFLIAENILKFYRSKAWFKRMLTEHPEEVDHFGGNEHIYRSREYRQMLWNAGFVNVTRSPTVMYAKARMEEIGARKWLIYRAVAATLPVTWHFMDALSLIAVRYSGVKP